MTNLIALKAANTALWKVAKILPSRQAEVHAVVERLCAPEAKVRYEAISAVTGVPWFIIAVIHEREASQNFNCQLGQGDPLDRISQHVPRGMGPYFNHPTDPPGQDAFYRCAVDTLENTAPYAARWKDWTVGGALTLLILYNGTGYWDYHHEASPYDWGATDQEQRGKYTGDGRYNALVWDTQIGCAAMLMGMAAIDPSVKFVPDNDNPLAPASAVA
jgi:lysozyme family protein